MYFFKRSCGISIVLACDCCDISRSSFCSALAGWCFWWDLTTNWANSWSCIGSNSSLTTHKISKRDKIGSDKATFSENVMLESYRPPIGLAAAITAQRACNDATRPAFEMEIDCCSMASWMDVRSWSFILSNSSARKRKWENCIFESTLEKQHPTLTN